MAHTAFPLSEDYDPSQVPARKSIEVRALVYYSGFEDNQTTEAMDVSQSFTPL